jgi:hypothetical protein
MNKRDQIKAAIADYDHGIDNIVDRILEITKVEVTEKDVSTALNQVAHEGHIGLLKKRIHDYEFTITDDWLTLSSKIAAAINKILSERGKKQNEKIRRWKVRERGYIYR